MDLTMTKYTKEKKEHALSQMSAPHNKSVAEVAQLTGVPEVTLYLWRKQAREQGRPVPGDGQKAYPGTGKGFAAQREGIGRDGGAAGAVQKVRSAVDRRRGRMIALPQRQELVADIEQACLDGAHLGSACAELGLSAHTFECWRRTGEVRADKRPTAMRPVPAHKLSAQERKRVLDVCHEARFADLPPAQIVPRLADEGAYLASESSFYRIRRAVKEQQHRDRAKAPQASEPQRHVAHGPNEVWSWDVTYLPSQVRSMFFYLYAVIDLFSRKLVA